MSSGLEEVWRNREEEIYPALFGSTAKSTFVLSADLFTDAFQQSSIDPRWLHYGVQVFPPTVARNSWLYVSSGASNPWELDPVDYSESEYSGSGTELVLETTTEAEWAVVIVQRMLAYNILLCHGRFGDSPPLNYGDRVPLKAPISLSGESQLRNLVIGMPTHYPSSFKLKSGQVDLLHLVGAADAEIAYAKQHGSDALIDKLALAGYFPVTDPMRGHLNDI
jgi:hypothetical protein